MKERSSEETALLLLIVILLIVQALLMILATLWGVGEALLRNVLWFADFPAVLLFLLYIVNDDDDESIRCLALYSIALLQIMIVIGMVSYLVPAPPP